MELLAEWQAVSAVPCKMQKKNMHEMWRRYDRFFMGSFNYDKIQQSGSKEWRAVPILHDFNYVPDMYMDIKCVCRN